MKVDHTAQQQTDEEICKQIARIYDDVEGIYGYRQMTLAMNRKHKTRYNHKRIYRWMRIMGLKSVTRIKKNTYKKIPADHVAENILNREFIAKKPNQKWLTDVTEFKTNEGKVYLSAFFDLHSNRVVSWKFGASNNNQLVFSNLREALEENPYVTPMIHSDRGYQYTSYGFRKIIESRGLTQSMSRVGKCIDNGPMEGFWGKIKSERYHLHRKKAVYKTRQELIDDIDRYIRFYNNERPQKGLEGATPQEYYLLAA
jgi:transposase InsO family protein